MLLSEFVEMTGFEPMADDYERIEQEYYNFNGNKSEFCRNWLETHGVQKLYCDTARKLEASQSRVKLLEEEVERLKEELDKEFEWKPTTSCGTQLSNEKYNELMNCGFAEEMTDEEAKKLLYNLFGFAKERISIIATVDKYEINRHNQLRISETILRKPLYASSDYNYIRFDCGCMSYEYINDELVKYES